MSSMGFYQVEPGSGRYWFGSPLFDKASINIGKSRSIGESKFFTITARNNSAQNRFIQSIFLNGKPYRKGYLEHKDIMAGGELIIEMGPEPALWY